MRIKNYLVLLFLFLSTLPSLAQLGSTHYIPPLHGRIGITDATVYLSTPFPTPINVTISRGDGTVLTTLTISQGNPAIYEPDLFANSPIVVQNSELNTPITDKGLILESTELFYVSLRTYNFNHAGYLTAKGEDALGQSFRLGSCPLNPNNAAHSFFASIMATEDNTSITFSDYDAANMTFENGLNPNPTLNAGETFVVSGYSGDPDNNEGFIGALLTADKPIVVNSGNLRGTMPNPDTSAANWSDHMIDQIVDESATGFEYMLIRGGGNPVSERPLIIANQDNTEIFVNGNPIGVTLNTGEYIILDDDNLYLPADPNAVHRNMYISTNDDTKSIYVYQFLAGRSGANDQTITPPDVPDATPGMNFIPPLSCFFQNDVDLIPAVDEIYPNSIEDYVGNLLITSRVGNTVTVNGTVIPVGDALGNPGTPDWETYFLEDQMGDISIIADGPIAVGLFGSDNRDVSQGLGGSAGFGGYYSGFAVTPEDTETDVCTNAGPINLLDRFDGNPPTGGTWTPALNSGTDIFDPLTDPISNPSLVYNYVAIGECDPIDVDITITLVDAPALNPIPNIDACETFSLPDPSTISGNFLNNPQYYDGPQISPTTNLIDWTIPITTTTTIFIFDEVEADPDNCTDELSFTITVNDFAIANPVPDQIVCDDPTNDGLAIFNLTPLAATVLGAQSPLSYTVTFHTTPLDATNGTAPIATPGAYQTGTSTIFARIENNLSAICFDTTPINLIVDLLPVINQVPDQINCDDTSNDGSEVFDLDGLIPFIIAPLTPSDVNVSFHLSQNDADNNTAALVTTGGYNSPTDEIFIRVENIANTSCFDTSSFMVIVNQRPIPVDPGPFVVCDNTADGSDTNGFVEFNLGSLNNTILGAQDPTQFTLTYHIDANDALLDQSPLPLFFTNTVVGGQPIFVRLENDNFTDCFTVISFDLVVGALPVIINPAPLLTQCDIDNDGFAVFNLTEGEVLISADFVNETFQYFDQAGNSIADPIAYTNAIVNNETIDVIVSTVNGCTRPAQLLLEVDTSQIPANFLLEYTACDTDGDLVSVFDFSDATAQVLALFPTGQLLTVSYYETLQEAQSEVNAIPDIGNYTNNIALTDANGVQGIYVRVDGDTANDCIGLGIHVQLTVLPNPVLNTDVTDFVECSDDGVFGIFDLTSKDIEITGGNPDYVVSYYASLADYTAVPPIAIPNPTIYPNTSEPQTIYYSAVNTITGCSTFDEVNLFFELFINENPTTVLPTDLIICDEDGTPDGLTTMDLTVKNAEITGGFDPTVTVSYHLTLAGANVNDTSIPDPTMFTNTTNIQIVFARVTDNITGCFSTEPLRIEVFLLPVPVVPADLEVCDVDNDGIFDFFILSDVDAEITGGDTSLTVVYYLTMDDANNAPVGGEIDNMMYINVNDPFFQTVYARVFNAAGCFAVVPLNLVVLNTPMPNDDPDDYELCDDDDDGLAIFDLLTQEAQILDGLDPTIFTIEWFVDAAAVAANVPIADPSNYTSNTNTVIAVVTDIAQSATTFCSAEVILNLVVNPLPTPIQPAPFELCDDLASGSDTDELSTFDLRGRDDEITGGNDDWIVSYHFSEADADAGMPTLPDMYQNVVPASQTVWVRVEDAVTGCYDLITLTLVVNQLPSPTPIPPVEVCDDDFDGIAIFDLTSNEVAIAIINGETNFDLSFHETLAAAELGTPAIADPANYSSGNATIYVRATDTDPATSTECFRVIELELVVNPIPPIALPLPDLTLCNDGTDQAVFDLTDNEPAIIGTLDPTLYTITYHEMEMDAINDVLPIGSPDTYLVAAPGTMVWVRLEDNVTECASIASFDVTIAPIPVFTAPPATLEVCDTEGPLVGTDIDGISSFDLTTLDAGITAGDPTLVVTYYESQADLDAGIFIDPADAYVNTVANLQTIFIQISSTEAGMCMTQTTIDLVVNPLPFIAEPLPASIACDDDNDGFGMFDLQAYSDAILAGLPDVVLRFYETFDNAQTDNTAEQIDITTLYDNITGMSVLYILAENTITGCTKIYSFELLVFPMPDLPLEIDDLRACDDDSDGFALFDLTSQEPAILVNIPVVDQGNFIVTYHNTAMDAMDGTAAILNPDMYTNQVANTTETIFVRVETNDGTPNNCPSFIEFDIEVVAPPVINPAGVDLNITVCNDDGPDVDPLGTFEFDLTIFEDDITGGDDLLNVTYYASLADLASDTPIATPEAYTNIINSQTIQIVVSPFDLPDCSTQGSFEIEVLPLPSPGIPTTAVELCDDDLDGDATNGIVEFDLTPTVTFIAGGEPVDINIFDDLTEAEATPFDVANVVTTVGGGEILYTNTTPGGQTLYARVDSTVSIVDGTACFVIVPFDVVVNPLPILSQDTPFDYTFCEEFDGDDTMGEVDLTTLADDAGFLVSPQNTSDFNISYHNTAIEAENNAFPIDQSVLFTVTDGDEIFFRIENIATGCVSLGSVIFTVETRPLANPVDDITQCADDPGINGIPVQDVSTFDLTQQNAVITGGEPTTSVVYYTSLADAQNMENPIADPTAYVNTSDPQTIYARAINTASMCESTDIIEFMIFVEPLPFTDLSDEGGEICVDEITGEALDPFIIDGSVEDPIAGVSYAYTWTRDGTLVSLEPTVLVDQQGEYEVTIIATYDNGAGVITSCSYTANTSYLAVSAPVFEAVVLESSFNPGGLYTVEVINVSGFNSTLEDYEFAIDDGPYQSSTIFTGVTPGDHTVFGRRITGECSISQVEIGIIDYPRFFTPNNDGFHDTWNIIGIGVAPNLNAKIYIFDRFGKLLKQLSPTSEGWDGTFNGQPMISDDYWFRVNYTEPDGLGTQREFVGHFTLKR